MRIELSDPVECALCFAEIEPGEKAYEQPDRPGILCSACYEPRGRPHTRWPE